MIAICTASMPTLNTSSEPRSGHENGSSIPSAPANPSPCIRPNPNTTENRRTVGRVESALAREGGPREGIVPLAPDAPEVPDRDDSDRQGDEGLDDRGGRRHQTQCGQDERHRVRDRERRGGEHDVTEPPRSDDKGEQEEDVVDPEQQMLRAQDEEVREPLQHRLLGAERRRLLAGVALPVRPSTS